MGKVLQGNESGLVGYWRFTASSATDLSSSQKNGTFKGEPKAVKLLAKTTSYIEVIGNSKAGQEQFGKISEFRVWHLALKDEEVAVNSKTRLSGNEPGLVAYYPLNEATGTEVRDKTGSGNKGTVVGSWWGCNVPIGNLGHQVMQFDGTDDYIQLPAKSIDFSQGFTVEAWVYYNSFKNFSRIIDFGSGSGQDNILFTNAGTTGKLALYIYRGTTSQSIEIADVLEIGKWVHLAATIDSSGNGKLFKNGQEIKNGSVNLPQTINRTQNYIGKSNWSSDAYFDGKLAEVRIWNKGRTATEIQANMYQSLTGKELGLVGYWPLNSIQLEGNSQKVLDLTGNNNHGTVNGAMIKDSNTLPIGGNALVSAEYSTITIDKVTQAKTAIMRRFFATALNGVTLLPDKRIERLELKWIGNAQFAPTLLGYIEGSPPVPSENLTLSDNYNGATSVELTMSEDVAFSWNRSQDSGLGAAVDTFIGGGGAMSILTAPMGVGTSIETSAKVGFKGDLDLSYNFQNQSNITSSSSLSMTDKLELRGTPEETPNFPHLGNRFIPKNVGYALVVSSLADVFITKLARSGKMIGYQVQPVDGIPPDVNTITFLINPAYMMNGSLDGLTGSSATSQRFFKHVPQMRAQYGSLYPASYYRLQEAYNLKRAIEAEDKRRESYFSNFDVRSIDETSLNRNIDSGDAPTTIGVQREEDKADTQMTDAENKAAQDEKAKQLQSQSVAAAGQTGAAGKAKQAEIKSKIDDQEQRVHATESFAGWQKRMENIQIRAGKRNIVNTYVWDADGGLRTEAQSFANTVEHTIGGSFSMGAGLGVSSSFSVGAEVELTAQATVNLTQTMSKTEARSKGFQLNVDLSGLEFRGITNYNDRPILPGEKVDRYRFMSFYLEGSTQNFQDFFSYVVDPEWLASNDEEARALRQTQAGKPNKAWRVMHRVTYVERPALMGFGQDVRTLKPAPAISDNQQLLDKIAKLEANNQRLEAKIDQILKALQK
ncbi:MAG: LamG domain-containing protein [Tolypothrix carrinoi HA7290-LM1]|nr:LamG domain-containing protein [Tolypothrix carrinoi HA7290-LM1]